MRVVIGIPARMGSTRFPGKPLCKILDHTMIEHCYKRSCLSQVASEIFVAGCDKEIQTEVARFEGNYIDTNKNIGYQYGLLYEDNCLGIDFNYYRDLTIDRDIKESDGYSFTIVLKPFGSTRNYGKSKVFGPSIK